MAAKSGDTRTSGQQNGRYDVRDVSGMSFTVTEIFSTLG